MAYAELQELKAYKGIDHGEAGDDSILSTLLDRVTTAIETYTGRVFEAASDTRYFESDALDAAANILWMDQDLVSVTTLTNGDDDATVIPPTEYWLMDRNYGPPYYGIRIMSNSDYSWEWDTDGWVSVLGVWGWSLTPPEDVKQACIRWADYAYAERNSPTYVTTAIPEAGIITVPQGIPVDVELLLKPYKRLT